MLKLILIVIVLLVGLTLIYASSRPNAFRIERRITIYARPEKIFPLINDFHQWVQWSPWEKIDPNLKRAYSDTPAGIGTIYDWDGNNNIGKGRMEITDAVVPNKIIIKLDLFKPLEAHNTAEFILLPQGDATEVSWAMYGSSPFVSKLMGIFINMDQMIGKSFEEGLANLKTLTER